MLVDRSKQAVELSLHEWQWEQKQDHPVRQSAAGTCRYVKAKARAKGKAANRQMTSIDRCQTRCIALHHIQVLHRMREEKGVKKGVQTSDPEMLSDQLESQVCKKVQFVISPVII